jgi:BirA family biotin operon repressor/biotin-[acetyl-CoA-carboxylase] ligase
VNDAAAVREEIRFLGVPIERHASIGSTNDEVFRRAEEGAPEGLLVTADVQTAGRGRRGRTWWDAPGASLPFSLLLRSALVLPRYPLFALAMACSVAEAGEAETGAPLTVKWPNDVLHDGRKLCGILAESRAGGAAGSLLVIGTGVNVNQLREDFPHEIRDAATSLRLAAGKGEPLRPLAVLRSILAHFERYVALSREDEGLSLWRQVVARLPEPGTRIAVRNAERTLEGTVDGYTEGGALRLIEAERGEVLVISAGEVV